MPLLLAIVIAARFLVKGWMGLCDIPAGAPCAAPTGLRLWFPLMLGVYLVKRHRFRKILARRLPASCEALPPGILSSETLGIVLYWFAGMMGLAWIVKSTASFFSFWATPMGQTVVMALFSSFFILWLVYRLSRRYPELDFRSILGLRHPVPGLRLWLVPAGIGLACAFVSSAVIVNRVVQPATPFNELITSTSSSGILLAFLATALLLAPFLEEVIFRGFFFYVIERLKGKGIAVVVIALVFAAMHYDQYWGDWAAIIAVTVLGFFLTFLRAWTGSSRPGMVAHYAFNGGMTIIPLIMVLLANPVYFEYQIKYPRLSDEKKETLLLESLRDHPGHGPSLNDLAWLYAKNNENLDRAMDLVNRALAADPENYAYLDTKAEVFYRMGEPSKAVGIEQRLVDRYPDNEDLKKQLVKFQNALIEQAR